MKKQYQIRYIIQESTDGVLWREVANCASEEEALDDIKELEEQAEKELSDSEIILEALVEYEENYWHSKGKVWQTKISNLIATYKKELK